MTRTVVGLLVGWSVFFVANELPAADEVNPTGKPAQLREGATTRYCVWRDEAGWHIRTTTGGNQHEFQGTVRAIGGTFASMELPKTEGKKGKPKTRDAWAVSADKQTLAIELKTRGSIDGCDFQLSRDVRYLDFDLRIDGASAPERIYIGKEGVHPASSMFKLQAVEPNGK
jgi:hypothetical protein